MSRNIKIVKNSTTLIIFTIAVIAILFALGIWQLARLKVKNQIIESLKERIIQNPLDGLSNHSNTADLYKKYILKGKFLSNKNILLYRARPDVSERHGYYLLTPFQTLDNKFVLIARGWIAKSNIDNLQAMTQTNFSDEIMGITLPTEKPLWLIQSSDTKNIWFTLDINGIARYLNLNLENYYIFQINHTNLPNIIKPMNQQLLLNIHNKHLEYAITWFSLAFCVIILIFYHRNHEI